MSDSSEIYRSERYVLGFENDLPYIKIDGEEYNLSCHPYEPCLYIKGSDGRLAAVRNAFDPSVVLSAFSEGNIITSITGFEYDAEDFCRMVEYAAGKGEITISNAEKVFSGRAKKKAVSDVSKSEKKEDSSHGGIFLLPDDVSIIENDPFYNVIEDYPDCVVDYCLVKNEGEYNGIESHFEALITAAAKIIADEWGFRLDAGVIKAKRKETSELFAPESENGELNYSNAFLNPPYPCGYTLSDFERVNSALFPNGKDNLEIFNWSTDWSEYFDDGHEWWGTLCLTVYDKSLDRFAVILASATD